MQKKLSKITKAKVVNAIIASMTIFALTSGNFFILGKEVVAATSKLNTQNETTLNKDVKFDTFFKQDNEKTHYLISDVNKEAQEMYINLSVTEGYLKNASIEFSDRNYLVADIIDENQIIQKTQGETINLKQLSADNYVLVLKIAANPNNKIKLEDLNKESKITFNATQVNSQGKEKVVQKEIKVNVEYTQNMELELAQDVNSYFAFSQNGENKVLVKIDAKLNSKFKNNLPVKETIVEAIAPKINGVLPESATIIPKNLEMTNGQKDEKVTYSSEQVSYNKENGLISIKVENKEENGYINVANGQDEYYITYIYPTTKSEQIKFLSKIKATTKLYTSEKETSLESNVETVLTNEIGKQVSLETTTDIANLSKGKLYANSQMDEKIYETMYNVNWSIDVTNKDAINTLRVEDRAENFVDKNNNKLSTLGYTYYVKTIINKNNLNRILGDNGIVKIYNGSGDLIATIDNTTAQDMDGNYVITYPKETSKIIVETTKPIQEGTIYIKNTRAIKADLPYSKEQIKEFAGIELQTSIVNNYVAIDSKDLTISLEETNTNANIILDKTTLSTLLPNENVEIKIELDNNRNNTDLYKNPIFLVELPEYIESIDVKSANVLYDNNLKIQDIQKIELDGKTYLKISLTGVQDGFSTGTFTNGTNIVLNTDIRAKVLTPNKQDNINLYYLNQNAITYSNEVMLGEQVLGAATQQISYSAPKEMIASSTISNYESTGKTVTSIKQGVVTDKIAIHENEKVAKMDLRIVNNIGNKLTDVVILGRIPFKGNKDIITNAELGTTMDTTLKSAIIASGIEAQYLNVYYSENGDATKDLTNTQNAWTTTPQDLSKVKSYMIVLNGYEMQAEKEIDFSYNFEIPERLSHDNSFYGTFGVYYTNNDQNLGAKAEVTSADIVGLTTGEGPKLDAAQVVTADGSVIREGQILTIRTAVKNTGSSDLENVVLREYIPNYTRYTEYKEASGAFGDVQEGYIYPETKIEEGTNKRYTDITIGKIGAGEIAIVELQLHVDEVPGTIAEYYKNVKGFYYNNTDGKYYLATEIEENADGTYNVISEKEITQMPEVKISNEIAIFAKDLENPFVDRTSDITLYDSSMRVNEKSDMESRYCLKEGQSITYTIDINNIKESALTNVKAEKVIPTALDFKEAYVARYNESTKLWENAEQAKYDSNTGIISWNIGNMAENESKRIVFVGTVKELPQGVYEEEISTTTVVYADGITGHNSSRVKNIVAKPNLVASIKTDASKEYVAEGDKITYTISVVNKGKVVATNVEFEDLLPNELKFVEGTYVASVVNRIGEIQEHNNRLSFTESIEPDEEITIKIVAEAKNLPNNVDEVTIKNYATFSGTNSAVATEEVTTRIEQSPNLPNPPYENNTKQGENNNGTNSENEKSEKTYRIRGTAWIDSNANGARESDEQLLEGIQVILTDATTGQIVKDTESGAEKITTTAKDGSYVFENLKPGEYIVVFYYNNEIYGLTDYRKSGVSDSLNSDVIAKNVRLANQERLAGITDTIRLNSSSYANIDIGLVNNKKFDFKLDKTITKVNVQNKEGVKSYNYSDVTLAKVDLTAKNMTGSTVVAEYKIKVTNEGNVAGYVKNIVDYMPKEMSFNSGLNPNWYAGNDGYLYNTELSNQIINPGETKEISLVLTKQVGESKSIIVNNLAEVYEDYNELGVADVDSKTKNRAQGEDDMGSADLIITIKTGGQVVYTSAILIGLVISACALQIIRKKTARYYN